MEPPESWPNGTNLWRERTNPRTGVKTTKRFRLSKKLGVRGRRTYLIWGLRHSIVGDHLVAGAMVPHRGVDNEIEAERSACRRRDDHDARRGHHGTKTRTI